MRLKALRAKRHTIAQLMRNWCITRAMATSLVNLYIGAYEHVPNFDTLNQWLKVERNRRNGFAD
jgi:hypothetical protein